MAKRLDADFFEPIFGNPVSPWQRSFAWLPRSTYDEGIVWLRPVWKRLVQQRDYIRDGNNFWWQYRILAPRIK